MNALIGSSGFVGSNLKTQYNFDYEFSSTNINNIKQNKYNYVFCAAPSAIKWKANQNPISDTESILSLIKSLEGVEVDRFILFSTVDVYSKFPKTEDNNPDIYDTSFYGKNRILLENYIVKMFPKHHIIRLPGLFGKGLKKNIIFDLLNNNISNTININDSYQWFYLQDLNKVINYVVAKDIRTYNVSTEPITNAELINHMNVYVDKGVLCDELSKIKYDIRSKHNRNYLYTKLEILEKLNEFINLQHSI